MVDRADADPFVSGDLLMGPGCRQAQEHGPQLRREDGTLGAPRLPPSLRFLDRLDHPLTAHIHLARADGRKDVPEALGGHNLPLEEGGHVERGELAVGLGVQQLAKHDNPTGRAGRAEVAHERHEPQAGQVGGEENEVRVLLGCEAQGGLTLLHVVDDAHLRPIREGGAQAHPIEVARRDEQSGAGQHRCGGLRVRGGLQGHGGNLSWERSALRLGSRRGGGASVSFPPTNKDAKRGRNSTRRRGQNSPILTVRVGYARGTAERSAAWPAGQGTSRARCAPTRT